MNITKILSKLFAHRITAARRWAENREGVQRAELARMIKTAARTEWGTSHGYADIRCYEDYRERVPVTPYETLRPMVMRMIKGERNLLWPGRTMRFAQSSGTSDGKSKYIPITDESLHRSHYRGGGDVVAHYLHQHPDSRLFSGKSFILGGSFANELNLPAHSKVKVGDLSANLIDHINPLVELLRVPRRDIALMSDWSRKLPALAEAAMRQNVTNISGVPSWFLTVLREILERSGAKHLHEVWPNLEVFFHGGISFAPYHAQYDGIIDPTRMCYMETYNASEGFFALQDNPESHAMLLLMDAGTFFEFIPADSPSALPIPAWEVEQGKIYALVITSCNGLWRYPLGDTVLVGSTSPLRITIAGRTKHFINAFGEEVMVYNTDAALAKTCDALHCEVLNYTAAPVYTTGKSHGRHEWLIEFSTIPEDMDEFAMVLDRYLQQENSDYQAKRSGDIFLDRLSVVKAAPGLFDRWLASTGKLGGQRKVPRLCNDRHLMDRMLEMNNQ